jgi:siroheme synthase-like protein
MNTLFPIFLKLDKIETLVVGGGNVGLEKTEAIFSNSPNAKVTLVAPLIKEEINSLAQNHPTLLLVNRNFEWNDMNDKQLIICATDNKPLHLEIYQKAKEKNILINVADTPDLCDLYLSSVVKKGDLKIAISTNGKSPTFAKRLKEMLTEMLDSESINELLNNLGKYRDKLKGDFATKVTAMNELTKGLIK